MQTNDKSTGTASPGTAPKPSEAGTSRRPQVERSKVQGEGDYEAARRHRESATGFARSHDVEAEARDAAPRTLEEACTLLEAERKGRERTRGEDRRDVMQDTRIDSPRDDKAR